MDLLHQRLALVVVLEVLGVELVILGVGGHRVVVVGAVKVVAAVRVPRIALEQLLAFNKTIYFRQSYEMKQRELSEN